MASFAPYLGMVSQTFETILYSSVQNSCRKYSYFLGPSHILLLGLCAFVGGVTEQSEVEGCVMERPAVCHA